MSHQNPILKTARRGGFTLVELLIVVIILAILAAIVIPQFTASTSDARDAAIDSTLSNMRTAIDLYRQQHDDYPAATSNPSSDQAGALAQFWDELTKYTKTDGTVSATKDLANFPYGPYLRKNTLPKVNDDATLVITDDANLPLAATGTGGWIYSTATGQFRVNDPAYDGR